MGNLTFISLLRKKNSPCYSQQENKDEKLNAYSVPSIWCKKKDIQRWELFFLFKRKADKRLLIKSGVLLYRGSWPLPYNTVIKVENISAISFLWQIEKYFMPSNCASIFWKKPNFSWYISNFNLYYFCAFLTDSIFTPHCWGRLVFCNLSLKFIAPTNIRIDLRLF